jgi:hypothetical protein
MESQSKKNNQNIFRSELTKLKEEEYITEEHYAITLKAHQKYYSDLTLKIQESAITPVTKKIVEKPVPQVVKPEKKKLTPEEVRERNISWLLNLGVILLLIGGLFVATSNWETMPDWMKSGSIAFVSLLFYGIAYISSKILKIERTSFAFIILGSLFLPIFILSIGWFELLGSYLSFYGEGRYILGAVGSFLLAPLYALFAQKLKSRLFVWFSYIVLTAGAGYTFAAFNMEKDGFYLGIMLFNALLVVVYHRIKNHMHLKLFSSELVYFAKINLILSTILMLIFFDSHVFYSINVLLTAVVYLSMVYVTGKKEYHFVFSAMIVYGAYQLIEHSVLDAFGPVFYAIVGAGFLVLPKVMDGNYHWDKVFRITSAVVSGLAFLYISLEGILMSMNEPSLPLLVAYLIIATQFTYLAYVMKNSLFSYLSPVFLALALYEVVLMLNEIIHLENIIIPVFMIGFVIYISFGYIINHPLLKVIQLSSRDVGITIMFFSIFVGLSTFDWITAGITLLLFSFVLFLLEKVEKRSFYTDITPWTIPFSFGLAFMVLGEEMRGSIDFYQVNLGVAMNAILASTALILLSYLWKINKQKVSARNAFFMAQGFYTISIIAAFALSINEIWMRPAVLLGGVGMFLALYKVTKLNWIPFIISAVSLLSYFTIIFALDLQGVVLEFSNWIELPLGAVILLGIAYSLLKKDSILARGFSWIGHLYLPLALVFTYILFEEHSIWSFAAAFIIYWISSRVSSSEWKVKVFLYCTFLALFMVISTGMYYFYSGRHNEFAFLLLSCAVFAFWLYAKREDKQRTIYFLIPWSVIGIMAFLTVYPFGWLQFVTMIIYSAGLIVFLHTIKKGIFVIIPLFLIFSGTLEFLFTNAIDDRFKMLVSGGFGFILTVCGKQLYKRLLIIEEKLKQVDSYTFMAILFFLSMYLFPLEQIWAKILPGILISMLIYFQRKRISSNYSWIPAIFSGVYLLEPYYSLLRNLEIPALISRELYILPLLAVVIFARIYLKDRYRNKTGQLQWAVLVVISLLLIQDGMASNTVYDALIVGTLSLASLLVGTFLRIKSYFFVGSGVLLLNVLLQTRPYWGNLPWWAYLLIAGSILITVASYNEWQKQKTAKGEETLLSKLKKNVVKRLKEWQ